ncbi:SgcJ/EcaC family oxidoreductase [Actinocrinis sp.]|uniref:SgcJ/EcaC family oxidoreductase n=1 Tax=Actinocrinis sp. TaxID=1920516 RepID=UPI002D4BBF43|nr:SgcJ/EcaC family oxidoreductase [Actinocrinis sp.]HZP49643.1 SgcJ/EcaC family oxidoreductase [Actinocrinis sp.]
MSDTITLSAEQETAYAVVRRAMQAWADNDADAFTDCYADDASVVLPGGVLHRSRDEIRAYMAAGFAGPLKGTVGVDQPEVFSKVGNDAAIVVSLSGYRNPDEPDVAPERLRRATWVLAERDGAWQVKAYHNCSMV